MYQPFIVVIPHTFTGPLKPQYTDKFTQLCPCSLTHTGPQHSRHTHNTDSRPSPLWDTFSSTRTKTELVGHQTEHVGQLQSHSGTDKAVQTKQQTLSDWAHWWHSLWEVIHFETAEQERGISDRL